MIGMLAACVNAETWSLRASRRDPDLTRWPCAKAESSNNLRFNCFFHH